MGTVVQDALALTETGSGRYEIDADRTFYGHESLFGGYAQALMLEAMTRELGEDKRPATITSHFLQPFHDGLNVLEVTVERTGRSLSTATCRAYSGGTLAGVSVAGFSRDRNPAEVAAAVMPDVAPVSPDEEPVDPGVPVAAFEHFGFHPRFGGLEFGTADGDETGGWLVPPPRCPIDASVLTLYADMWMPAIYRVWDEPTALVSADITVHFRRRLPAGLAPGSPVLVHSRTHGSLGGFVDDDMTMWAPDGRLLAQARQARFVARSSR